MQPSAVLAGWANFYVIVGSSAAALTGLQFVVIALIVNMGSETKDPRSVSAFATPTVVHLSTVLVVSAVCAAPWPDLRPAALALGACAAAGLVYSLGVLGHARRQTSYRPVLEDWIFHVVLPVASYAAVLVSALELRSGAASALYAVAAATLLLLLTAIHNAWDTATYVIVRALTKRGS
jgi:hypothetical protein